MTFSLSQKRKYTRIKKALVYLVIPYLKILSNRLNTDSTNSSHLNEKIIEKKHDIYSNTQELCIPYENNR